ncbi:YybH family protein [Streptomyces sp. NPDC059649]|uniref:YybH family protein n=1 Tax=Streptomyces sp. NPDC059649 TaxID=3346895 RepID=UPI003690F814
MPHHSAQPAMPPTAAVPPAKSPAAASPSAPGTPTTDTPTTGTPTPGAPTSGALPGLPRTAQDVPYVFAARFNAGDADAVHEMYAPDAVFVPPDGAPATTPEEIRRANAAFLALGLPITVRPRQVRVAGDTALLVVDWEIATGEELTGAGLAGEELTGEELTGEGLAGDGGMGDRGGSYGAVDSGGSYGAVDSSGSHGAVAGPVRGTATDVARRGPDGHWRYLIDSPFGGSPLSGSHLGGSPA